MGNNADGENEVPCAEHHRQTPVTDSADVTGCDPCELCSHCGGILPRYVAPRQEAISEVTESLLPEAIVGRMLTFVSCPCDHDADTADSVWFSGCLEVVRYNRGDIVEGRCPEWGEEWYVGEVLAVNAGTFCRSYKIKREVDGKTSSKFTTDGG